MIHIQIKAKSGLHAGALWRFDQPFLTMGAHPQADVFLCDPDMPDNLITLRKMGRRYEIESISNEARLTSIDMKKVEATLFPSQQLTLDFRHVQLELEIFNASYGLATSMRDSATRVVYAEGKTAQDVIDKAREVAKYLGNENTGEPSETSLPPGISMDDSTREAMNALFDLPPGNKIFTAEQLVIAIDMGLVVYDSKAGTVVLTQNGQTFFNTVSPGATNGTDPDVPAAPANGAYNPQQQTHIADAKAIDAAAVGSDRFTRDELMKMGFHPWMADWLLRNCSSNGSDISLDALKSLDGDNYFDLYQGLSAPPGMGRAALAPNGEYHVFFDGLRSGSTSGQYTNCNFIDLVMADPYWATLPGGGIRRDLLENFVWHINGTPSDKKQWGRDPDDRTFTDSRRYNEFLDYWYAHMDGPDAET